MEQKEDKPEPKKGNEWAPGQTLRLFFNETITLTERTENSLKSIRHTKITRTAFAKHKDGQNYTYLKKTVLGSIPV